MSKLSKIQTIYLALEKYLADHDVSNCTKYIELLAETIKTKQWNDYKKSYENLSGADMYTIVILLLFASIIIILMIRAIKPSDSIDDQVVLMLNSMRVRVDDEHSNRERKKLREAKQKIQAWLNDMKGRSVSRLSFRKSSECITHQNSQIITIPDDRKISTSAVYSLRRQSFTSLVNKQPTISRRGSKNSCYSFFVPEIVVTNEHTNRESNSSICSLGDFNDDNDVVSSASSCPISRPLSSNSGEVSNSS
uniref:Uncharacterized protein n=1 Tax=Parastrongyloides trichosuri TaxID=131310 RepID=A0A0N5A420_PARTI